MERTPAGIRPIFSSARNGPTNSQRQLLGRFLDGSASVLRGFAGSGSGVASGSGGIASSSGGVASSSGSRIDGGVASGSGGVSSSFLRGFHGFFLLGAAGEDQGGEGGGESDLRVH